jgi:hypothetical protein
MINVVSFADLAVVGYNLARDITAKEKELKALKEAFRQMQGAGHVAYANGVIVEISPPTERENINRKPIEDELGIDKLIAIGGLVKVPVAAAVRFRK